MKIEVTCFAESCVIGIDTAVSALECFGATSDQIKSFKLAMEKSEPFPYTIAGISINTNLVLTKA